MWWTWLICFSLASVSVSAKFVPISDLPMPSLYLDLHPNPYGSRPPPRGSQNGAPDVEYDNNTLISLGLNSEHSFPKTTTTATLICNATYPITWVFHNTEQSGHASWMISLRMSREAGIVYDPSTYSYTAELGLNGDYNRFTGNYSCRSTTRPQLHNSVFVYWEGSSPPFLLQAGENRSACIEKGVAILPCAVSKPDEGAVLWKSTDKGYVCLHQNNSITYDPKVGFMLLERDLPALAGDYMCTASADGEPRGRDVIVANPLGDRDSQSKDYVNIKVEHCSDTLFVIDPNKSNATLTYDNTKGDLVCCSSSSRAPIIFHAYCHHPVICSFRQEFDAYFLKHIQSYFSRRNSRRGCTKYRIYVHSPGVVRCIGDGIDRSLEYSFPIIGDYSFGRNVSHIPIYFNWNEIQPQEMMIIQPTPVYMGYGRRRKMSRPSSPDGTVDIGTVYEGQWLYLYCHTSPYYFAEGIQWAIKYKNHSQLFVKTDINSDFRDFRGRGYGYYGLDGARPLYVQAHSDMESVVCIAPVWNSTEYIHKLYHIHVNESIAPTLLGPTEEVLTWVLNDTDKQLTCEGKGVPIPEISWSFTPTHGQDDPLVLREKVVDIQNTSYTDEVDNSTHIVSETILITRVSYSTAGVYNCVVTNYGGSVYKIIEINVEESASWKTIVVAIVGTVLITALVVGLGFLVWRLRIEKRTVHNLAAISYQDAVTRRISEINPNYEDASNGSGTTTRIEQTIMERAMEAKKQTRTPFDDDDDDYEHEREPELDFNPRAAETSVPNSGINILDY